MDEAEDDEEYESICRQCKKKAEKVMNPKTMKPYIYCEKCRENCGKRGNKKNKAKEEAEKQMKEEEEEEEIEDWKQIIFKDKDKVKTKSLINVFEDDDIKTEENSEQATEDTNNNDNINGEIIAGRVENVDNIRKDLTTLSLNEKVEYIIDFLENEAVNKNNNKNNSLSRHSNDKIDMIYETFNNMNEAINEINNNLKQMKISIL